MLPPWCRASHPLWETRHRPTSPRSRGGGRARGRGEVRRDRRRLRLGVGDSFGSSRGAVSSCLLPPCSRLTGLQVRCSNPPTALHSLGGPAARFWPSTPSPHLSTARHGSSRPVPEYHKQSPGGQQLVRVPEKLPSLKSSNL